MQGQQICGTTSIATFGGRRCLIVPFFTPRGSRPPVPSPSNNLANPPRWTCRCPWTASLPWMRSL